MSDAGERGTTQTEGEEDGYVESEPSSFDHPNVQEMDNQFLVTMNNEHVVDGFTPIDQVPLVKLEAEEMALMELIYAGEVDVETSRAVTGGKFTLHRAIDRSTNGFERKMKVTQIGQNYEYYTIPKKLGGFKDKISDAIHHRKSQSEAQRP